MDKKIKTMPFRVPEKIYLAYHELDEFAKKRINRTLQKAIADEAWKRQIDYKAMGVQEIEDLEEGE